MRRLHNESLLGQKLTSLEVVNICKISIVKIMKSNYELHLMQVGNSWAKLIVSVFLLFSVIPNKSGFLPKITAATGYLCGPCALLAVEEAVEIELILIPLVELLLQSHSMSVCIG